MNSPKKLWYKNPVVWLGFAVSLVLLWLAIKEVQFVKVVDAIADAQYRYLLLALSVLLLSYVMRSFRWRLTFSTENRVPSRRLFSFIMIGYMANNVLPARIGEIVRAHMLCKKEKLSRSYSLATIFVERICDLFVLLIFLVIIGAFLEFPSAGRHTGIFVAIIFIFVIMILFCTIFYKQHLLAFFTGAISKFSRSVAEMIVPKIDSFVSGLESFKRRQDLLPIVFWSILIWVIWGAGLYLTLLAFRITIPIKAVFFMVSFVNLGVLIPSSPGFIGTYQYLCVTGLAWYNVDKTTALSFSVVFHALWYIPLTLIGAAYFWKEQLNFKNLSDSTLSLKGQEGVG